MRIKKSAHAAYRVQYHIVWSTRFKRKILVEGVKSYLRIKILEVQKYYPDWEFSVIGFGADRVHVSMEFPPKYSGSYVVETINKNTSRELKKKFKFLKKVYWDNGGVWSAGYFFSWQSLLEELLFCPPMISSCI